MVYLQKVLTVHVYLTARRNCKQALANRHARINTDKNISVSLTKMTVWTKLDHKIWQGCRKKSCQQGPMVY